MPDLTPLRRLSAKLGVNLNLVQAGGGNTSLKDNGTLWVKASGKWLARAMEEEMFLPVPQTEIHRCIDEGLDYTRECLTGSGLALRPSVETSMHAVFPQPVVVHVHSVNTIAWAIRTDAPKSLEDRLAGLRWQWLPYIHPGIVLGKKILDVLSPDTDVLVLGNHGLVVGADDCDAAEDLLEDVERRLAVPLRTAPKPDLDALAADVPAGFEVAPDDEVHALAMDPLSLEVAKLGTLYPDQCVYVGPALAIVNHERAIEEFVSRHGVHPRVLLIPGKGVLVANDLNRAGREVLISVKRVIERLAPGVAVHALSDADVSKLIHWDAEKYRIALAKQYDV